MRPTSRNHRRYAQSQPAVAGSHRTDTISGELGRAGLAC
ncbi:hypothetical protein FMEAI12_5590001 [Parafrankia sp. Ea1.12]|nr:hypothetical protein FMEAI12_5590001 [Parafrankia sp. Ea1.12]